MVVATASWCVQANQDKLKRNVPNVDLDNAEYRSWTLLSYREAREETEVESRRDTANQATYGRRHTNL